MPSLLYADLLNCTKLTLVDSSLLADKIILCESYKALEAFFRNFVDLSDDEEYEIHKRLFEADVQAAAISCTYIRALKWFDGKATLTRGQANQAMGKMTTEKRKILPKELRPCHVPSVQHHPAHSFTPRGTRSDQMDRRLAQ